MRVTSLFFLALVATSSFALQSKLHTAATAKKIAAIKQQGGWASIILDMAELHVQNSHPLDELKEALHNVMEDVNKKLQQAHEDFAVTTEEHEEAVNTLHQQINHAIEDISRSNENLTENLYPTVDSLNKSIAKSEKVIDDTKADNAALDKQREDELADYQQRQADADEGIRIMEECIEAVNSLLEGGELSLAQVQSKKETLEKAEKLLKNSQTAELQMALALTQLATNTQEIDHAKVRKIIDLFHQNINNLTSQKAKWAHAEENAVETYNQKKAENEQTILKNQDNISDSQTKLEIVHDEIKQTEEFIARRKAEQASFEQELEEENEAYEEATKNFEDLVAQLTSESDACAQALDILEHANFADVIEARLNDGDHLTVDWQQSRDNPSVFGEGYEGLPSQ